jgi:hypothetical protein
MATIFKGIFAKNAFQTLYIHECVRVFVFVFVCVFVRACVRVSFNGFKYIKSQDGWENEFVTLPVYLLALRPARSPYHYEELHSGEFPPSYNIWPTVTHCGTNTLTYFASFISMVQCYLSFYTYNLQMFRISWSVCRLFQPGANLKRKGLHSGRLQPYQQSSKSLPGTTNTLAWKAQS